MYRIQNAENSEAKISDNNIQFLEYLNAITPAGPTLTVFK